ncbi:MAG: lysine biosynthesis protein LysX [Desulfurococcales archaeon]|nr:lysine biosynthesis protein LysX [Desulfurococcales archaeon]
MVQVAVLHDIVRLEEKLLFNAFLNLGASLRRIYVKSSPIPLFRGGLSADVALQRCLSHTAAIESTFGLEASGIPVINSSFTLNTCLDKAWTASLLAKEGIPQPKSFVVFSLEAALKVASELTYPVVVKPLSGSWGALVSLARDEEELRTIIEHRMRLPGKESKAHFIQEFVRKPGRDIRVTVVGDEVVAAIYRKSRHWITNTARGGVAEAFKPGDEVVELSLKVREVVGGDVLGVDLFEDPERGYLVNEVNAVPEFKNVQRVTGVDVASAIAKHVVEVAKK